MFDIGFAELLLISVVGLLVIGPERLPGAIRTTTAWISRLRRSFNEVKAEVQRELHNDEVMQELKKTAAEVKAEVEHSQAAITKDISDARAAAQASLSDMKGMEEMSNGKAIGADAHAVTASAPAVDSADNQPAHPPAETADTPPGPSQ